MSTFKERVESYVGDTSFDSSLTEWLTDSARALVNLVPQNRVNQYSLSRGADGGVDVTDCRVLGATRSSVFAREIHHGESTKAADVNSLYIARADDPVFYTKDGTLYVLPTGGSPETQVIPFPTVLFSDDEIDNFPDDFEHLVVLRAAIQATIKLVTDYQELVFSDV